MASNKSWTDEQVEYLQENYSDTATSELCDELGRSKNAIHHKARRLGLEKSSTGRRSERINVTDTPEFDEDFGNFICGFVAGEGTFVHRDGEGNKRRFQFSITLVEEDREILEQIQDYFGVGNLYTVDRGVEEWDQQVMYTVQSIGDLIGVIIPFFDEFSLRSTKKERQFEEFRSELEDYLDRKI